MVQRRPRLTTCTPGDTSLAMAAQWSSVEVDPVQLTKGRRRGNA